MTRLLLAAGVAALAIATPAAAKPGDHGAGQPQAQHGGGGGGRGGGRGGGQPQVQRAGGGGGTPRFQQFQRAGGPRFQAQAYHGGGGRFAGPRVQRAQNFAARTQHGGRAERVATSRAQRGQRFAMQHQSQRFTHQHGGRAQLANNRALRRPQLRNRTQLARNQHQFRMNGVRQAQNGVLSRHGMRASRLITQQQALGQKLNGRNFARQNVAANVALSGNSGKLARQQQLALQQNFNASHASALRFGRSAEMLPVTDVQRFVGSPLSTVSGFAALGPMPAAMSYLYPPTPDYYYQFGGGYVYQIDRTDNIIAALIPLLAGGYLPGQYLPAPYMASYVPNYYGFNAFYPDYGGVCNRYAYGVVYQVDCYSGMVQDVIPVYANGYGVGQMLPSSYAYYNVPYQYRRLYYDTSDYNYWYAPGAIYQYDPRSSMITSVAALLSPGFAVGQALPAGYDAYNVPYSYRGTYFDTPTVWYRYSNGYIYQVDPATRLVTAAVASLLT
jgi:hypothetical protein